MTTNALCSDTLCFILSPQPDYHVSVFSVSRFFLSKIDEGSGKESKGKQKGNEVVADRGRLFVD